MIRCSLRDRACSGRRSDELQLNQLGKIATPVRTFISLRYLNRCNLHIHNRIIRVMFFTLSVIESDRSSQQK
ncbi:hypothetical protein EMIT0P258_280003 [Pseudomonas sp. IT-P258]